MERFGAMIEGGHLFAKHSNARRFVAWLESYGQARFAGYVDARHNPKHVVYWVMPNDSQYVAGVASGIDYARG